MSELVERARLLAYRAHAGQMDKAGLPYILHVARVAAAVSDDPDAESVAWLHDVIEDNPDLANEVAAFPQRIHFAVLELTRGAGNETTYYLHIRLDPLALRVKLADIADNADESRLPLLDEKTAARLRTKYQKATRALTGDTMTGGSGEA